jgi:Rod binding domain-containing protein
MSSLTLQPMPNIAPVTIAPPAGLRALGGGDSAGGVHGAATPLNPLTSRDFAGVLQSHVGTTQPPQPAKLHELTAADFIPGVKKAEPATEHERLTKQAEKWVAQTFYGTLLKQMHESPFKSDLFDGGRGGQAFSSLYDQQLADRMSRGAGGKLVKTLVRRIEGRKAYKQHAESERGQQTESPAAAMNQKTLPTTRPAEPARENDNEVTMPPIPSRGGAAGRSKVARRPLAPNSKVSNHVAPGV